MEQSMQPSLPHTSARLKTPRAAAIAKDVSETVAATGLDKITRPQLDRILDSVVGEGLENPGSFAEAGRAWPGDAAGDEIIKGRV